MVEKDNIDPILAAKFKKNPDWSPELTTAWGKLFVVNNYNPEKLPQVIGGYYSERLNFEYQLQDSELPIGEEDALQKRRIANLELINAQIKAGNLDMATRNIERFLPLGLRYKLTTLLDLKRE